MKFKFLFLFIFIAVQVYTVSAQDTLSQAAPCFQPVSYKFDEFEFTTVEDAKKRLVEFENRVKEESKESRGFVQVYGGKQSRVTEIEDVMAVIRKILNLDKANYNSKFAIWNAGYRWKSTVVLYIKPLNCSQTPNTSTDLDVEQIEFAEAPPESTVKKDEGELQQILVKQFAAICPPAAVAVRACPNKAEVYVIINEKGDVIFSAAVSGHPLIRAAAAQTVRSWKFQPTVINGKKFNVTGRLTVEFKVFKVDVETIDN